jgi:hypothetical protein
MGYDATCTMTVDGKTSRGTAWLEDKDLVFRGPVRLSIPLATIRSATAQDGTLSVRFGGKSAEFAIGGAAEKWARRITNPPSRLDKLGVKAGMAVASIGVADEDFLTEVAGRAEQVARKVPAAGRPVDLIFLGVEHRDTLARISTLAGRIKPDGALWIVRPKGRKEITEAETMAAGKRAGLVDVKVVSFSETHTAEKFVIPVAKRPAPRREKGREKDVGKGRGRDVTRSHGD